MLSNSFSNFLQTYGRGLVEPPGDYHADNSRSDLSDILEEEEEDFYSDHIGETQAKGYTVGANRVKTLAQFAVTFTQYDI